MTPDVLYLDNHLLVVNKPAGLLSQADRTGDEDVLEWGKAFLKKKFDKPGAVFLGLVHRLDRPVSGVMVLARTSKAAARLSDQVRRRAVTKRYLAVVEGTLKGSGTYTDFLSKEDETVRIVKEGAKGAKEAVLQWEAIDSDEGLTLVAIRLETGRSHQVRIQFASRGTVILGDFRYGSRRELDGRNLALHCAYMAVDHPTRGDRVGFGAEPPDTWPAVLRLSASEWVERVRRAVG